MELTGPNLAEKDFLLPKTKTKTEEMCNKVLNFVKFRNYSMPEMLFTLLCETILQYGGTSKSYWTFLKNDSRDD